MVRQVTLAVCCLITFAGKGAAQVKLAYQFKAGETLEYALDVRMKVTANLNGMDSEFKVDQTIETKWVIEKVDKAGVARVRIAFDRVKMTLDGFFGSFECDSRTKEKPKGDVAKVLHDIVQGLAAAEMTALIEPTGQMRDVTLTEASAKKLEGRTHPVAILTSAPALTGKVQGGAVFAKGAVKKNESWSATRKLSMFFGHLIAKTENTYEGPAERDGRKVETVTLQPDFKIDPDMEQPMKTTVRSTSGRGTAFFDNAAGRLIEQITDSTIELSVEQGGVTRNQTVVQTVTIRLKR